MTKLYALKVAATESSFNTTLACSNEICKLEALICSPGNSLTVVSDPSRKMLRRITKEDLYPQYSIYEIPYVV